MEINNIGEITKELYNSTPENVVSVGYGRKMIDGKITSELSIIFGVTEKKPLSEIPENELLPSIISIDGENVKTDVVLWETPKFLTECSTDFYDWQTTPPPNRGLVRPIVGGVSITNYTKLSNFAGTVGFVAVDNETNSLVGVTNAHVLIDDMFLASERTNNSLLTNVANNDVTQPSSGESGYVNQNNKVGIVKRYKPFLEQPATNSVDVSIFTLNESDINVSTAYQQLGLTGWTQPMVFATQNEILNLVINNTPLYSSGRTTGAKGEGEMKLIPYAIGLTTNVTGNNNQGVPTTVTFTDCISFIASGSTTPTGYSCIYPIAPGDSGSVLIGEFDGIRKIVGLNFAGNDFDGFANYITNVQSLMNISPYTGQTVNYSDINNIQYHYVSGKSSDVSLIISDNKFWQVGLSDGTPTPTSTPNLIVNLDAGDVNSYSGGGTTWTNLVDNTNYTINNGTFDSGDGGSIVFNGSSTFVSIGSPLLSETNYTMEAWVNASVLSGGRNILSSANNVFWVNGTTLSGGVGGSFSLVTSNSFPTNVWRHVALTFNDTTNTMTLYINGVQVSQNTSITQSYISETLRIGSHFFNNNTVSFWNGKIAEVRVYDDELVSTEILENFNSTKTRYGL